MTADFNGCVSLDFGLSFNKIWFPDVISHFYGCLLHNDSSLHRTETAVAQAKKPTATNLSCEGLEPH